MTMDRTMSGEVAELDRIVSAALAALDQDQLTRERIRQTIDDFRVLPRYSSVSDEEAKQLGRQIELRHSVRIDLGSVLKSDHEPWLEEAKLHIDPFYWSRYKNLLAQDGFGNQVLARLDQVSDRVLGLMENPDKAGPWDRRGLVLGNVQSGKTANYLGLVCKAADAGYRVIIVIAGIHNILRNQTQSRVDMGFIGTEKGTEKNRVGKIVGVGKFDLSRQPFHFTSSLKDFNKATADAVGFTLQNLSEPAVFVIKKNPSTLKSLINWIKTNSRGQIDSPVLIIDDEADNASINVGKGIDAVSRINGQIRDLLQLFERRCYVGYTATPFANIFIDPDSEHEMIGQDLFPRDFIVSLDPPSNYLGAKKVFLERRDDFVRMIEDNEDLLPIRHSKSLEVAGLPCSLKTAVRAFVLVRATRLARGQLGEHNSMLVNASRFTDVQTKLRNEIHHFVEEIRTAVRIYGEMPMRDGMQNAEILSLKVVWDSEYAGNPVEWDDVYPHLYESVAPITVVEVNSRSTGALTYQDSEKAGLNVIAVGGYSLSRGLTLEGLSVTYFLRNSMMYDTLMQMGRWFGYHPGYEDLCRIWMPEAAADWYTHVSESIEILREDLREMESVGARPIDFGLRVRSHPDTLIVTARNKIGTGQQFVVSIGLGNEMIETTSVSRLDNPANVGAVKELISSMSSGHDPCSVATRDRSSWLFAAVPVAKVRDFIAGFKNHQSSPRTQTDPVLKYIDERRNGSLALWDVLVVSISETSPNAEAGPVEFSGLPVFRPLRSAGSNSSAGAVAIGGNQRVASRGIERTGLTREQVNAAESKYRADLVTAGTDTRNINFPDRIYRRVRERPLLMIHLLRIRAPRTERPEAEAPPTASAWKDPGTLATWGASFPKPPTYPPEKRVEFIVNTVWVKEHFGEECGDEEMEDELEY